MVPKGKNPSYEIDDKIKLEFASLRESFHGAIVLDEGQAGIAKPTNTLRFLRKIKK